MITGRDDEFRATIAFFYQEELHREPDPGGMASFLDFARNGGTGEQIRQAIHDSPEAVAYRARPAVPPIERLIVHDLRFVTASGKPWTMAFADSFRAYERFLRGEELRPHLRELVDLGANGVRVLGSFDFGDPAAQRLYPSEHSDYYAMLPPFFELLASMGLYAQFCVFADTKRSVPGGDAQLAHWTSVCNILAPIPNVLLQRVNEGNQHENGVDADLPKPADVLSSFGSNGAGNDPPTPFWDYCDLGSERRGDFALSATTVNFAVKGFPGEGSNPGFVGTGRATVVSEPPGFGEVKTGNRTNDPRVAFQLGLGAAGWGAGGCAHSDAGVQSVMLSPTQKECVRQFLRGVKAAA